MDRTTDLEAIKVQPHLFTWGKIVEIHHIGTYDIVEYYERKVVGCEITKDIDYEKTSFHCYFDGKSLSTSCPSLDAAIVHCIAEKNDGCNTRADYYFMKMISQ